MLPQAICYSRTVNQFIFIIFFLFVHRNLAPSIMPTRMASQWPTNFVTPPPIESLTELKEGDNLKEYAHAPIKAAVGSSVYSSFYHPMISKMTNHVMADGKKTDARKIIEDTFFNIKLIQVAKYNRTENDEEKAHIECRPSVILVRAIENSRPLMQLMPVKRGGITYRVPFPLSEGKSYFYAYKWLKLAGATIRGKVKNTAKFAAVLVDAAHNRGSVVKQRNDLHKQCEANRAYAHFRWLNK